MQPLTFENGLTGEKYTSKFNSPEKTPEKSNAKKYAILISIFLAGAGIATVIPYMIPDGEPIVTPTGFQLNTTGVQYIVNKFSYNTYGSGLGEYDFSMPYSMRISGSYIWRDGNNLTEWMSATLYKFQNASAPMGLLKAEIQFPVHWVSIWPEISIPIDNGTMEDFPVIQSITTGFSEFDIEIYEITGNWSVWKNGIGGVTWTTLPPINHTAVDVKTIYSSTFGIGSYANGTLSFDISSVITDWVSGAWSPEYGLMIAINAPWQTPSFLGDIERTSIGIYVNEPIIYGGDLIPIPEFPNILIPIIAGVAVFVAFGKRRDRNKNPDN